MVLVGFSSSGLANDLRDVPPPYQALLDRLIKDGLDKEFLSPLFLDRRAEPIPNRMTISLLTREIPEIYAKFLTFEWILLAKSFLRQNLTILKEMERRFDVEKEVAVAILLVESRFGENIGKHRVIPTLASMAIMGFNSQSCFFSPGASAAVMIALTPSSAFAFSRLMFLIRACA